MQGLRRGLEGARKGQSSEVLELKLQLTAMQKKEQEKAKSRAKVLKN